MKPLLTAQQEQLLPLEAVAMARSMVSLIGLRDQYTASHSARVANYVRAIAKQLSLPSSLHRYTTLGKWGFRITF
jgi:HD-GYP domain-containing protein (c-di-GMP phosphodiesterase class II)